MDFVVNWENAYQSPSCGLLKIILCDEQGKRHSVLAIGVENSGRTGSVRVRVPKPASGRQKWKVRVASESANYHADSESFSVYA